jgi:hypothetical protein
MNQLYLDLVQQFNKFITQQITFINYKIQVKFYLNQK